jgi:hypothetical protein
MMRARRFPPMPQEAREAIVMALEARDLATVQGLLAEHDPRAKKREMWHPATEQRLQLLRGAWDAFRDDLGPRRQMQKACVAPGEWSITALNDYRCRIEVARVTCEAARSPDATSVLRVVLRAPGLVGDRVRALLEQRAAAQ